MAESLAFRIAAETLEAETDFDRLEARGTVRILLKRAGLDAKRVTAHELRTVATAWLEEELHLRGIEAPVDVLNTLIRALAVIGNDEADESPEAVFERLGERS